MILTMAMAHQRKLIRQAVVALLTNANTAAAARVKATRVEPHKKSQLPAIAVYTLSETSDDRDSAPVELTRDLKLEITAWVSQSDPLAVDDAMDDIAEQIEAAMAGDYYIADTAAAQVLTGTEMQVVEDDGRSDPLVGIITLTYSVTYRSSEGATASDGFVTVGVEHRIVGAVDANAVNDQFQEPQ